MTAGAETALLVLLVIFTLVNTIVIVGLVRQVGLLHVRINPVEALTDIGGPSRGDQLLFREGIGWTADSNGSRSRILAFLSPGCSLCEPLLPGLQQLAKQREYRNKVTLVVAANADSAHRYVASHGIEVSHVADEEALDRNAIPGAPYVAVGDNQNRLLAGGNVNSLEQIELLIAESSEVDLDAPQPEPRHEHILN